MLTVQELKDMKPSKIFATGVTKNAPDGMRRSTVRWVAVRGGIHDWAIYVGPEDWSPDSIARSGDKVHDRNYIKEMVPCDDEALAMYRD